MNKNKNQSIKYRPYLTETDIRHILSLARADSPLSFNSKHLIKTLSPYLSKIENDGLVSSYTSTPRKTIEQSLGITETTDSDIATSITTHRHLAYIKWSTKGADSCTIEELDLSYEYRVHNNLLSKEELDRETDSWKDVDMSEYTTLSNTNLTDEDKKEDK